MELEHLKIETRLIDVTFTNVMGEYVTEKSQVPPESRLRLIRKTTVLVMISPHFDFSMEENAARRKWKYDDPKFEKSHRHSYTSYPYLSIY